MDYRQTKHLLSDLRMIAITGKRTERELLEIIEELNQIQKLAIELLDMKARIRECPEISQQLGISEPDSDLVQ